VVKILNKILTLEEQKEKGLEEGYTPVLKWVERKGKRRKLFAFARHQKTGREIKLKIPRDTRTTVREMTRLARLQNQEILVNPKTREYYIPPIQFSKYPRTPEPCT